MNKAVRPAAVAAALILAGLLLWRPGGGGEGVAAELLGTWRASDGPYAGRGLAISETTISFLGEQVEYGSYPIHDAQVERMGDSELHIIRYSSGGETLRLSFYLELGAEPVIRLERRPSVAWRKEASR